MLALPNKEVLLCKAEFFWQKLEKVFLVPHGSRQNDVPISPISTQQLAHTVASVALTGTVSSSECKQRCAVVCVRVINGQHTMHCFISCIWAPPLGYIILYYIAIPIIVIIFCVFQKVASEEDKQMKIILLLFTVNKAKQAKLNSCSSSLGDVTLPKHPVLSWTDQCTCSM